MLLYLPLAHNFGRLMSALRPVLRLHDRVPPRPAQAAEALTAVRPTVFPSVPRVYEKVLHRHRGASSTRHRASSAGWSTGRSPSGATEPVRQAGEPVPAGLACSTGSPTGSSTRRSKRRLGGRLRSPSRAARRSRRRSPSSSTRSDILILEGYGLTECTTAVTMNRPERYRFGTVGPALPGFEVKIAADGELLIRGDTIFAGLLPATRRRRRRC